MPSSLDVIMRAQNPSFMWNDERTRQANGGVAGVQAPLQIRLGGTTGVKKNKSVMWGEDVDIWLMQQLIERGISMCHNPREKAQMNKDHVAAMQREFGLTVDGNCVKNK